MYQERLEVSDQRVKHIISIDLVLTPKEKADRCRSHFEWHVYHPETANAIWERLAGMKDASVTIRSVETPTVEFK